MKTMRVASIPGAMVNELGQIKLPEASGIMPMGNVRRYATKWRYGTRQKAAKSARHEYFGIKYRGVHYKMHRLVCEAFHGPAPFDRAVVLHLNENGLDNCPGNLRWGTRKENLNMPGFIEYCKSRTGPNSPRAKGLAKRRASV